MKKPKQLIFDPFVTQLLEIALGKRKEGSLIDTHVSISTSTFVLSVKGIMVIARRIVHI